jgi:hypothetical protein
MRPFLTRFRIPAVIAAFSTAGVLACSSDKGITDPPPTNRFSASCPSLNFGPAPTEITVAPHAPVTMQTLGGGTVTERYTAEVAVRGNTAYTTSWGTRFAAGNAIYVWDVAGDTPVLVDTVLVDGGVSTIGDVAVSPDGQLLVVGTERTPGWVVIYDLADPRHPKLLSRFTSAETLNGVHTAEIGTVNGKLYAFLAVDLLGSSPSRVTILDLSTPGTPRLAYSRVAGTPFAHDSFQRSGLLFVGLWTDGTEIWDIGGCGTGATPEAPRVIGNVKNVNGRTHNIWWYHDAAGSKSFAFVGEEGPASIGSTSTGDIHVIDLSEPSAPKEVAFYHVDGAGTHNFSVDETNGILYAAYYNGGVRALDIRGDLGKCPASQQVGTGGGVVRCDLKLMGREMGVGLLDRGKPVYVWGVQYVNGIVYASDMLNGIWKLRALAR